MPPKDYRRFGSPFDPKFSGGGKIERPKETPKLRGCGDPNCATCNPETAAAGVPPMSAEAAYRSGRSIGRGEIANVGNPFDRYFADLIQSRIEETNRVLGDGLTVTFDSSGGTTPTPARPPESYRRAREAVEKWIVPAPEQSFEDIIGNDDALAGLKDVIRAPVIHKELYEAYGLTMPKGALLSGPPGCGKTMFAKAAASEMKKLYGSTSEFISISGSSIQSPYVGVTESYIVAIFKFAREYKTFHGHPLLVFIDEADALFPDRTGRVRRVASWEESNVAAFLAEMDGMQTSGAFVLLATNRPEALDEAVLRDGRCDFKITVKRPIKEAVHVILSKGFEALPIRGADVGDLTFAALEALYDPAYVIHSFGALEVSDGKQVRRLNGKDFALEHVLSGAMASSIPGRASRKAFARDKTAGTRTGVNVSDVLAAVKDVFGENKRLEHAFALREFLETYAEEVKAEAESTKKKGMN
jgi:SpoVK/Ycf46/Vps4 family AAA+-type ATPase